MSPQTYADLGRRLWRSRAPNAWGGYHGPDCLDLPCADARAAMLTVVDTRRRSPTRKDEACWRQGATKLGMAFDEYRALVLDGQRYCCGHKRWEPLQEFGRDSRSRDGRNRRCSTYLADEQRARRARGAA